MTAPPPIPLALVTGPRSSGKSRLINAVLAEPAFAGTLALANETGATPLACPTPDLASLTALESAACLCCAGRGAFAGLLEALLRGIDNQRIAPFSRLIFETAGEADPAPMLGELLGHPYLGLRYRLESVLAVVPATADFSAESLARQIACADALVLTGPIDVAQSLTPVSSLPVGIPVVHAADQPKAAVALFGQRLFRLDTKPEPLRRRIYAGGLGRLPR